LMDVNHRRINNLSNVSIRICIFHHCSVDDSCPTNFRTWKIIYCTFLSFDRTTNPFEDHLDAHAASDWMMKWSGSVGEMQTDAAACFLSSPVARRLKSIKT
jgi:hypothetical protein